MSEDKRPAPPDAIATLGTIIDATAKRDAIHIAVIPLPAAHKLFPGQDVGVVDGQATAKTEAAGIVDPFLKAPVQTGEWFWMFLYPRTITSLRHVWSHPAFTDEPQPITSPPTTHGNSKAAAEKWLRDFVSTADCPSYEEVLGAAVAHPMTWDQEYLHFSGHDAHGEIPAEFWDHVEVVTGKRIEIASRAKFFSCGC